MLEVAEPLGIQELTSQNLTNQLPSPSSATSIEGQLHQSLPMVAVVHPSTRRGLQILSGAQSECPTTEAWVCWPRCWIGHLDLLGGRSAWTHTRTHCLCSEGIRAYLCLVFAPGPSERRHQLRWQPGWSVGRYLLAAKRKIRHFEAHEAAH